MQWYVCMYVCMYVCDVYDVTYIIYSFVLNSFASGTNVEMTAVAFAAPGIGVAEALLFGQDMKSTNRLTSITVQPQNDIVSRIEA